jgi:uncharacterized membrane protein YphA (DoxX/SURF4 family)
MKKNWIWIPRIIAAIIMLQTLFFKFSGAEESIYIFRTVGIEPWGRYGSGVVELVASILIIIPRYSIFGAILALGTMSGAIFFHLTLLGIEVMQDGGQLFIYALLVFFSASLIIFYDSAKLMSLFNRIFK